MAAGHVENWSSQGAFGPPSLPSVYKLRVQADPEREVHVKRSCISRDVLIISRIDAPHSVSGGSAEACVLAWSWPGPGLVQAHLSACRRGEGGLGSGPLYIRVNAHLWASVNDPIVAFQPNMITSHGGDVYWGLNESFRFKAATCWDFVLPHVGRWMRDWGLSKLIRQGLIDQRHENGE